MVKLSKIYADLSRAGDIAVGGIAPFKYSFLMVTRSKPDEVYGRYSTVRWMSHESNSQARKIQMQKLFDKTRGYGIAGRSNEIARTFKNPEACKAFYIELRVQELFWL